MFLGTLPDLVYKQPLEIGVASVQGQQDLLHNAVVFFPVDIAHARRHAPFHLVVQARPGSIFHDGVGAGA